MIFFDNCEPFSSIKIDFFIVKITLIENYEIYFKYN